MEIAEDETRLFWVVDNHDTNEEIFETLETAQDYGKTLQGVIRTRACIVKHAYREADGNWNYDDLSDTFRTVLTV